MSPEAKDLLRELYSRPEWKEIIEEIQGIKVPRFKPIKTNEGLKEQAQFSNWAFFSGREVENDRIVKILIGDSNVASRG